VAAFFPPSSGHAPTLGLLPLHKHKKFTTELLKQKEDLIDDVMI
jgi:hypothetical protein